MYKFTIIIFLILLFFYLPQNVFMQSVININGGNSPITTKPTVKGYQDDAGNLWVLTKGGGLHKF